MRRLPVLLIAVATSALFACEQVPTDSASTDSPPPASGDLTTSFGESHTVDFEGTGIGTGNSIEGLGRVHDHVNIQSDYSSDAVLVDEGDAPRAYTGESDNGRINNGCLADPEGTADADADAHGFSDTEATISSPRDPHSYTVTFSENVTATEFSVDLLDHGDFNQNNETPIRTTLVALDADGNEVDSDEHSVSSTGGSFDACEENGLQTLSVEGDGITKIEIRQPDGEDVGTGFDNLTVRLLTTAASIDIKPGSDPNSINLDSGGVIPVAVLGSSDFDVSDVDVTALVFDEDNTAGPAHDLSDPAVLADHRQDVNDDGHMDLVTHWDTPAEIDAEQTEACMIGQTESGVDFRACDSVNIIG